MMAVSSREHFPLVTVVLTSYNYGRYIAQALESALAQDYPNLEVLVLDNGSTDGSQDIVRSYSDPRIRFVENEVNLGQIGNHNRGVELARGEYVVFLSADDYFLPGHISRAMEYYRRHPDVDVAYFSYYIADPEGRMLRRMEWAAYLDAQAYSGRNEAAGLIRYENYVCFPTVLWPVGIFKQLGALDTYVKVAGDFEFVMRVACAGYRFGFVDVPAVCVRLHESNLCGANNHVPSGLHMDESLHMLERHIVPQNYGYLYGLRKDLHAFVDRRIQFLNQYPQAAQALMPTFVSRIAEMRARIDAVPDEPAGDPLVSVIVPTQGEVALLKSALDSLDAQTYANWEAVVVADGCFDISAAIAALPYRDKVRLVRRATRGGPAAARNTGLQFARGTVIAYLDDDNIFEPAHLAASLEALRGTGAAIVRTGFVVEIERFDRMTSATRHIVNEIPARETDQRDPWVSVDANRTALNAVVHRRTCIERAGTFNEKLRVLEDWEFVLRLAEHFDCAVVSTETVRVRWRAGLRQHFFLENARDSFAGFNATLSQIYGRYPAAVAGARETYVAQLGQTAQECYNVPDSVDNLTAFARAFSAAKQGSAV